MQKFAEISIEICVFYTHAAVLRKQKVFLILALRSQTRTKQLQETKNVFLIMYLVDSIWPPLPVSGRIHFVKKIKIFVPSSILYVQYWFRTGSLETSRIHVEFNRFSIESHVWH